MGNYWIGQCGVNVDVGMEKNSTEFFIDHKIWYTNAPSAKKKVTRIQDKEHDKDKEGDTIFFRNEGRIKASGIVEKKGNYSPHPIFFLEKVEPTDVPSPVKFPESRQTLIGPLSKDHKHVRAILDAMAEAKKPSIVNGTDRQKGQCAMNETPGAKPNAKTLLALSGLPNAGKTQTIKKVYRLLRETYPEAKVTWVDPEEEPAEPFDRDICLFMEIGGTLIGIESPGDDSSHLQKSLKRFAEHQPPCDVILCARRTGKGTRGMAGVIEHLHTVYGYDIVPIPKKKPHRKNTKCTDEESVKQRIGRENHECANRILAQIVRLLAEKEARP